MTDDLLVHHEEYAAAFSGPLPLPPAQQEGDAHVIRNAGGAVTDDEIRSLAISQRLLGTTEVVLIHHTDCGMLTFTDLDDDVRTSVDRIQDSPFVPHTDQVRGFVFDVATGRFREVV